jgi:HK97 family phage portal protein
MDVFACIRVLGDMVAGLETHGYMKRLDENQDPPELEEIEVPLPRIVEQPYADVDPYDGDFKMVASLGLNGNHFVHVIDRDSRGNALLCEILNPSSVKVERIKGVKTYRLGAVGQFIDPNDIVHIPWVSLSGGDVGMNPIEIGSAGLGIAIASQEYASRWFAQGAHPSGILSVEKPLMKGDALRLKTELQTDHAGLAQSHVPLVLDSNTKWTQIGLSPDASQLIETRGFSRSELTGFYGVPPFAVGGSAAGADAGGWGRGLQETIISFSLFTLNGYVRRHARLWSKLCPPGVYVRKNLNELFKTNDQMLSQFVNAIRISACASPNDGRKILGMKRSNEPGADSIFAPLNSSPTDTLAQAIAGADNEPKPAAPGTVDTGEQGEGGSGA